MRVAKQTGSVLSLIYDNENPLRDLPWTVHEAVKQAANIIGWMELSEEDRPHDAIWLNNEMLDDHFDQVKARWNRESGKNEDRAPDFDESRGPVHQNPAAAALKAKIRGGK